MESISVVFLRWSKTVQPSMEAWGWPRRKSENTEDDQREGWGASGAELLLTKPRVVRKQGKRKGGENPAGSGLS